MDDEEIYLQADTVYAVAQRLARDGGDQLSVTLPTLKKRLKERGLLTSTEKCQARARDVERTEIRKVLQGKRRYVLHINKQSLTLIPPESEPDEPFEPSDGELYLAQADTGSFNGPLTSDAEGQVSHESAPPTAVAVFEIDSVGSGGSLGSQSKLGVLLSEENKSARRSHAWEEEI